MKHQITGYKAFEINQRRNILVDIIDQDLLFQHLWYISDQGYPKTNYKLDNRRTILTLHRLIVARMGVDPSMRIVFDNGNRRDCRRSNLIAKTCGEIEISKDRSNIRKSGVIGVYWESYYERWKVRLKDPVTNKYKSNGSYKDLDNAVKALQRLKEQLGLVDL